MRYYLYLLLIVASAAVCAEEAVTATPLAIQIDIVAASPVYTIDLNKLPPSKQQIGSSLIPDLARIINDEALSRRFNDSFAAYLAELSNRATVGGGHLVMIRLKTNDMGDSVLRSDFLVPIGAGFDPVDAHSEYLNRPVVQIPPDDSFGRDVSYYVWIQKIADGTFNLSSIVRELVPELHRQSTILANDKVIQQASKRAYKTFLKPSFDDRARHWAKRVKEREGSFEATERLAKIEKMVKRLDVLQDEHTKLVQLHEQQLRRFHSNQSFLKTLEIAIAIGSSIKSEASPPVTFDSTLLKSQTERFQAEVEEFEKARDSAAAEFQEIDTELVRVPELH